jgi:small subunit ribosomal protein S6e
MYELDDDQSRVFRGLKIGSEIDGAAVGVEGIIKLTGGSDSAGFPMRPDVLGGVKKRVLLTAGVGFRSKEKGLKRRKMVRGNTVTEEIYQINAVLISKPVKKKKEAPKAEKSEVKEAKREEAATVKEKTEVAEEKEPPKQKTPPKKEEKPAEKEEKAELEKSAKDEQKTEPPAKKTPKKAAAKTKEPPKRSVKK